MFCTKQNPQDFVGQCSAGGYSVQSQSNEHDFEAACLKTGDYHKVIDDQQLLEIQFTWLKFSEGPSALILYELADFDNERWFILIDRLAMEGNR